jgi:hypothetical protein
MMRLKGERERGSAFGRRKKGRRTVRNHTRKCVRCCGALRDLLCIAFLLIDESLLLLLLLQELGVVVGSVSWRSIFFLSFFLSVAGVIQGKKE